jgi:flagellar basal body rod protein FlgC
VFAGCRPLEILVRFGLGMKPCKLLWRAALAAPALMLFSGCNEHARRDDGTSRLQLPPTRMETPATPGASSSRPATLPPALRRSSDVIESGADAFAAKALLQAGTRARLSFSGSREDGQTLLRASGDSGRTADELLKQLGFKAEGGAGWVRWVKAFEREELETRVNTLLQNRVQQAAQIQTRLAEALKPGRLLFQKPNEPALVPGRLVYTGHPLDAAFSDTGNDPQFFLAVKDATGHIRYARGGRLYVAENGRLALLGGEAQGRLQNIAPDAEEVRLSPNGSVTAYSGGAATQIGRLQIARLKNALPAGDFCQPGNGAAQEDTEAAPLRCGHLEFPAIDNEAEIQALAAALGERRMLEDLQAALAHASARPAPVLANPAAGGAPAAAGPVVIHADLPWTAEHLKLLGINLERTPGRLTLAADNDPEALASAVVKVLQVLRQRMGLHEQNLRNADRIRDSENRLNPYRRKTIHIGEKGEPVEELDNTPFPKTYKPGDPNTDAEGFIVMPNVNKTVETTEFQAAAEEYALARAVAARLAPNHVFPDPPRLPRAKPEAP